MTMPRRLTSPYDLHPSSLFLFLQTPPLPRNLEQHPNNAPNNNAPNTPNTPNNTSTPNNTNTPRHKHNGTRIPPSQPSRLCTPSLSASPSPWYIWGGSGP